MRRHPLSLAFLSCAELTPDAAVHAAAAAGYDFVGLRFLPAATDGPYPIMDDPALQARVARALSETGVGLADIEIARLGPDTDVAVFGPFLELGERLGARNVLVAGDDADHGRLTETFARFCDLAAPHGLTADLEFMPWTGLRSLPEALRVVEDAARPNGGVLVDALHWSRSDGTCAQVRALPHARINYAQLCDGPVPFDRDDASLIAVARGARLPPGRGGIDLVGLVRSLPEGTVLSLEVPEVEATRIADPVARARALRMAAQAVLAAAGRGSADEDMREPPD